MDGLAKDGADPLKVRPEKILSRGSVLDTWWHDHWMEAVRTVVVTEEERESVFRLPRISLGVESSQVASQSRSQRRRHAVQYHQAEPDDLEHHESEDRIDELGRHLPTIAATTDAITKAASKWGKMTGRMMALPKRNTTLLTILHELEHLRACASEASELLVFSLAINKTRKDLRRAEHHQLCEIILEKGRALPRQRTVSWRGSLRAEDGSLVSDPGLVLRIAEDYFGRLYCAEPAVPIQSWVFRRWPRGEIQDVLQKINGHCVRQAVMRLKHMRTCSRDDLLVAEMLQAAPDELFDIFASLFQHRVLNSRSTIDDPAWDRHEITLIEKIFKPTLISKFRPIVIIPVLLKVYSIILSDVAGLRGIPLCEHQFAFRTSYQSMEPQFILRQLVEKHLEFGVPLFCFDGDLWKAYDCVCHAKQADAFSQAGVPRALTAAMIREVRRSAGCLKLPRLPDSRPLQKSRSIQQGDPEGPTKFNIIIDQLIVRPFLQECERRGWGVELTHEDLAELRIAQSGPPEKRRRVHHERLPLLLFADNYWILATTKRQLIAMTNAWHRLVSKARMRVVLSECSWISTTDCTGGSLYLIDFWAEPITGNPSSASSSSGGRTCSLAWTPSDVGIKVLGSYVTFNNDCTAEVKYRIVMAWAAFRKHSSLLLAHAGSVRDKFAALTRLVLPSLVYNVGSLHVTQRPANDPRY